jgi:tRNA-2-methylthio-N6-dimethylallyladenosine synthase
MYRFMGFNVSDHCGERKNAMNCRDTAALPSSCIIPVVKYRLITYGCQMNVADSEEMSQPLEDMGVQPTNELRDADIVLMNTCTVRDQAEHRAESNIGRLRKWKAADPRRILIVAGCAASRWGNSIKKRYPYIDAVSPATQIEQFPRLIAKVLKERWDFDGENRLSFGADTLTGGHGDGGTTALDFVSPSPRPPVTASLFGDSQTAYVTIMRGCNYACSYCIVPQVRGREVYRPWSEILSEVKAKAARGKTDVMLLGQTVNSYYQRAASSKLASQEHPVDVPSLPLAARGPRVFDFADLLRAVNDVEGVRSIRFMSPHPRHMRDRMIQAMAECRKIARHIHLPIQSGNNRLLALMRRFYTREAYLAIIHKLRNALPGLLITTDVIVGYPSETERDFQDTLVVLREVSFDGLFAFKFSPRPGTLAAQAPDDVAPAIKEERLQRVLALNHKLIKEKARW